MRNLIFITLLFLPQIVSAAILIEDGSSKKGKISAKTADDSISFKKQRRVGVGAAVAGPLGLMGAHLELNFNPETAVKGGFGGGPGYQAYTFQMKRALGDGALMPYLAGGYAHWYNVGGKREVITETNPTFLAEKFMSPQEKEDGKIDAKIIYPALGLQFVKLGGDWAGSSLYAEVLLLIEVGDFQAVPTGSFGYTYYF